MDNMLSAVPNDKLVAFIARLQTLDQVDIAALVTMEFLLAGCKIKLGVECDIARLVNYYIRNEEKISVKEIVSIYKKNCETKDMMSFDFESELDVKLRRREEKGRQQQDNSKTTAR